jgi:hypothetical protein
MRGLVLLGCCAVLARCSAHRDADASHSVRLQQTADPSELANQLAPQCRNDKTSVTLLISGSPAKITVPCTSVLHDTALLHRQLVDGAGEHRNARDRADAELRIERLLGLSLNDRDAVIWQLATAPSQQGWTCDHADDLQHRQQQLNNRGKESPQHWLLVEAAYIAGQCPQRLDALYRTVAAAGVEDAVITDVKHRVAQALTAD